MSQHRLFLASQRRGSVSHEAVLAVALATAVLVGVAHMLALVVQQRRDADRRAVATREAGNVMESLMSQPWSQLASEEVAAWSLSEACQQRLPNARLAVNIADSEEPAGAKHVRVEVHWHSAQTSGDEVVRLVAWRYPNEESTP